MKGHSSKTSLFLMELILSIFFFCLAAAVCVQMFVMSHSLSNESNVLNDAITSCQSLAESFYALDGDMDELSSLLKDATLSNDKLVQNKADNYCLIGTLTSDNELITLHIQYINTANNEVIYSLNPTLYPQETRNE